MKDQLGTSNPQSNKWQSRFVLLLRWLGGGIVGLALGLSLAILSETINPPIIGPTIEGQQEFIGTLIFYTLYDRFKSIETIESISLTIFFIVWGIIGALMASGMKNQIRIGVAMFFLYIIMGCSFYMIWLLIAFPT